MSVCHGCGFIGAKHVCARCKITTYCSEECNREHWNQHKIICEPSKAFTRMKPQSKKVIDEQVKDYVSSMKEYIDQINRENPYAEVEKLAGESLDPKTYAKIASAMLDGICKRESQLAERMNVSTMRILKELLRSKTTAKSTQINYIESELIKYSNAVYKLHMNMEDVEPETFVNLIAHQRNAWITIHGILGTDATGLDVDNEERIIGEYISKILLKISIHMVHAMAPYVEQVDAALPNFVVNSVNLVKSSTSAMIRKYANCFSKFIGVTAIPSVRERLNSTDAEYEYQEAQEQMENLTGFNAGIGKLTSVLHYVADGIEKNAEASSPGEKAVAAQILIASIFTAAAGFRYTYCVTTKDEMMAETERNIKEMLGKTSADQMAQQETLRQQIIDNEQRILERQQTYKDTLVDRTRFLAQITTSSEATKKYLSDMLLESGRPLPESLKPESSAPSDVPMQIADDVGRFVVFEFPQLTSSDSEPLQNCTKLPSGIISIDNPVLGESGTLQVTDMDIIQNKMIPFASRLMAIARWELDNNPAYKENFQSVQKVRNLKAAQIEFIENEYIKSNFKDHASASEYAALVYVMATDFSREMELFSGKTQEKQTAIFKETIAKNDAMVMQLLVDVNEATEKQKKMQAEMNVVHAGVEKAKLVSEQGALNRKAAPDHVVDAFFSDMRMALGVVPGLKAGVGVFEGLIKTNLITLFRQIHASLDSFKLKATQLGFDFFSIASFGAEVGRYFALILKVLLAVNMVLFVLRIVLPALVILAATLIGWLQKLMASHIKPNDADGWFNGKFQKGPAYIRMATDGIYLALGTIRMFLEGLALSLGSIGGALTGVVPALIALISCLVNLVTVLTIVIGVLFGPGLVAMGIVTFVTASVNLIYSGITLFAYAKILPTSLDEKIGCIQILSSLTDLGLNLAGPIATTSLIASGISKTFTTVSANMYESLKDIPLNVMFPNN